MAALVALPNAARCTPSSRSRVRASWSGGGGSGSGGLSLFDGQRQGVLQAISDRSDTSSGVGARSNGRSTRCVLGTPGRGHNLHREKVGVAPRHRRATGLSAHISPSTSSSTLSADSPIALRRAYDVCAYDDWCLERGIVSPALYIGYVGGGTPDQGETFRGCIATAPVAPGDVLVRCPSNLALALPPNPPNPFPDFVPDELWTNPPGVPAGRKTQELRMALVLLHEREKDVDGAWAPYINQLPEEYDLLGMWTDAQLKELQCAGLRREAWAQRVENIRAAEAVAALGGGGCGHLTDSDVAWGLNTVRSRSFLGKYPEGGALPPLRGMMNTGGNVVTRSADFDTDEPVEEDGTGSGRTPVPDPSTFVLPLLDAFNHRSDNGGATQLRYNADAATFELRSSFGLNPGDEATISYGKHTNDELLLRFGFCVEGNRDEMVPLPGCMAELDWLIADTDRERDMIAESLDAAVRNAHLDSEGRANTNLLWALRVLLSTDLEFKSAGGAKGLRMLLPGVGDGDCLGPQAAAEAALALACEEELRAMGDSHLEHWEDAGPLNYDLEEDEIKLAAAEMVAGEVATEALEEGCAPNADQYCADLESDSEDLRRLVWALTYRVNRKRILYACLRRYKPNYS